MNSALKTSLWLAALLIGVVLVSFLYSRSLQPGSGGQPAPGEQAVPLALPETVHPSLQAGLDALAAGDPAAAAEHLRNVPPDDPGYELALQRQGLAHIQAGNALASLQAFRAYSARRPNDPEAHRERGRAYFRVGRAEEAELAALRVIELAPNDVAARYDVALFRLAQDRLPEAISAYGRAMARDETGQQAGVAFEELQRVHDANPTAAAPHYAMAYFAGAMGQTDLELAELEHYLELAPEGPAAENARQRLAAARAAQD